MKYQFLFKYNPETSEASIKTVSEEKVSPHLIFWGWDHFKQCPIYAHENTPLPVDKFDSHFNHKRKVGFETDLALQVFHQENLFIPVLRKISQAMLSYLKLKQGEARQANKEDEFIQLAGGIFHEELYQDEAYFGRLGNESACDFQTAYHMAIRVLKSGRTIEHILKTFMAVDTLIEVIESTVSSSLFWFREELREKLLLPSLFGERGRMTIESESSLTTQFGITDKEAAPAYELAEHTRPVEKYTRDSIHVSGFALDAFLREIPFICGPSGHTAKLLCAAIISMKFIENKLSVEELKEFTLAIAAFLIGAGAHSFHEVYSVAASVGVSYDSGRYEKSLPQQFLQSSGAFLAKYSDVVEFTELKSVSSVALPQSFFSAKRELVPANLQIKKIEPVSLSVLSR